MKILAAGLTLCLCVLTASAQKVVYSEPDKNDYRQMDFDIIGKVSGNFLTYKHARSSYAVSVYDADMKQKDRVKLEFMPERVINADFMAYADHAYIFYQYQKKDIVYAMAAKLDGSGKIVGSPVTMDTTEINFSANNKIYSVINSDDKQYICLYKINSKKEDNFVVTTVLFDKQLVKLEKQQMNIAMPDRHDYLTEFAVDNEGDVAFVRAVQARENDNISNIFFMLKRKDSTAATSKEINLNKSFLDEVHIKVDNYNRRYVLCSFYSSQKRGNNEGMFVCVWDKAADSGIVNKQFEFDDKLRSDAKGDNGMKTAFNDYSIQNLIVRKDGGFLVAGESFFSTGRSGRYDYVYGSPYLRNPMDYYMFGPSYGYGYPWTRYNSFGSYTRYNAGNIIVLSFDSTGNNNWTNVVTKSQYDDETDAFIGYSLMNTGDQLYFLFNQQERRIQMLAAQSVSASGRLTRNPPLKNMDQGFDFMARYGKQTGIRQMIFPCMYRNYLCFAKVDF